MKATARFSAKLGASRTRTKIRFWPRRLAECIADGGSNAQTELGRDQLEERSTGVGCGLLLLKGIDRFESIFERTYILDQTRTCDCMRHSGKSD
jgi:hypothetical protein